MSLVLLANHVKCQSKLNAWLSLGLRILLEDGCLLQAGHIYVPVHVSTVLCNQKQSCQNLAPHSLSKSPCNLKGFQVLGWFHACWCFFKADIISWILFCDSAAIAHDEKDLKHGWGDQQQDSSLCGLKHPHAKAAGHLTTAVSGISGQA